MDQLIIGERKRVVHIKWTSPVFTDWRGKQSIGSSQRERQRRLEGICPVLWEQWARYLRKPKPCHAIIVVWTRVNTKFSVALRCYHARAADCFFSRKNFLDWRCPVTIFCGTRYCTLCFFFFFFEIRLLLTSVFSNFVVREKERIENWDLALYN